MDREGDGDPRAVRAGLAIYRCVLRLYPYDFRSRFADELEDNFQSMSQDVWSNSGASALVRMWAETALDAVRSLSREWLRTPWLPIAVISALVAVAVFWGTVGRAQVPLRAFRNRVVPGSPPPADSPALLLLMGLMVLIPVVGILVTWAISRLIRHHPPRRKRA